MNYNLIFATANSHKIFEVSALLPQGLMIKSLKDVGILEAIPETGNTLEENALQKARYVYQKTNLPCFADDTGLEIPSLNGAPGVHTARFSGIVGSPEEISAANNKKLLECLQNKADRSAQFRTIIAFINAEGQEMLFEGCIKGSIATQPRGKDGFGYDPIFQTLENITFAEMGIEEKNKLSHRALAFKKFCNYLQSINN